MWQPRQETPDDYFPSLTVALQSLLARHEAYMASAERDRLELTARIEQLERDNIELEAKNKAVTDENHNLQEELDQLSDTVKDAETKIEFLEETLRDSQREVRRLEIAAERAATLERQIAVLEEEQLVLQTTIVRTQEEARTAMYRWRQAEKRLGDLQDQLERMEKEAREERERHVEVMGRMARQRVMEKELNTAAGRLKGAAAAKSMTDIRSGGNVVSHFVRDLLQDNAHLQVGMAELREMLLSSNDEIQMLREQLMYHQPVEGPEPGSPGSPGSPTTLQAELEKKSPPPRPQPPQVSQELHIHHHYHVTHKPEAKKPRKKRQGLTPGTFTPPCLSAPASPITSPVRWQRPQVSPLANYPGPSRGRWSLQSENHSEFAPSSAPTSPQSTNRNSMFDRVPDLPSPGSPTTSVEPTSPSWKTAHRKRVSGYSLRSISETAMFPTEPQPALPSLGYPPRAHPLTHFVRNNNPSPDLRCSYTTDDIPADYTNTETAADETFSSTSDCFDSTATQRPGRRRQRTMSHESIISLSNGLDIHTLKARPSQLTLRPLGLTAAGTGLSVVVAQPTLVGQADGRRGSVILRDSIQIALGAGDGRERERSSSRASGKIIGKLVAWRPWGSSTASAGACAGAGDESSNNAAAAETSTIAPETSPSSTPAHSVTQAPPTPASGAPHDRPPTAATPNLTVPLHPPDDASATGSVLSQQGSSSASSNAGAGGTAPTPISPLTAMFRAPGINQPGMVPGFQEFWAGRPRKGAPSRVSVGGGLERVEEALREVLEG
ncbi:hypothetical protein BT67DRAFT_449980 [Trichocladium antarcticum]|uniref:Uncharacterized protein n=1 Tax=Trichocladium antarcticum TaxID=1450529 RepID=A0AAN6UJI8_9PEZI|nr:hypothetical protein BT67DRAFT_449980 [Trichocladium antarcticum]